MKKYTFIFILFLLIASCSKSPSYNGHVNRNMTIKNNYYASKTDILRTYDNGSLEIYKKDEIKQIVSELENDTKDLLTLKKADVLNVVGSPYLIKNEIVMELWQYRSPFCILNIVWDNSQSKIKEIVSYDNNLNTINNKKCILDTIKLNPDNKISS